MPIAKTTYEKHVKRRVSEIRERERKNKHIKKSEPTWLR